MPLSKSRPRAHKSHKCNGIEPCSNCEASNAKCLYKPSKFRINTYNQQQSFKAVQSRLAELEGIVQKHGLEVSEASTTDGSPDTPMPHTTVDASERNEDDRNPILKMLRDLSIGALGEYVGARSQVTMSRLITSMARSLNAGDIEAIKLDGSSEGWKHLSPKSASRSNTIVVDLASIPSPIADKLFKSYMRHIETRWPVMHTPYVAQLHDSSGSLADIYEYVEVFCC